MSHLLCRLFGHRWRWTGWAYRARVAPDHEVFECTRCPAVQLEEFGG